MASLTLRIAGRVVSRWMTVPTRSMTSFREERDTFGPIQVPAERYWGAQTQRYLRFSY